MSLHIRLYQPEDFDAVTLIWWRTLEDTFPEFQRSKGHTFEENRLYFRDVILRDNQVWVAIFDGTVAGFMAIKSTYIDHLYVAPDFQNRGIGQAFLAHARCLSPKFLHLNTFQSNKRGRVFYEKNGFRAVKFGVTPENEPDMEYCWP
jgi:GNAT superfamily N-acetyltransferase